MQDFKHDSVSKSGSGAAMQATKQPARPILHAPTQQLHSKQIFGARREVEIVHAGHTYRLRITAADKLILTK